MTSLHNLDGETLLSRYLPKCNKHPTWCLGFFPCLSLTHTYSCVLVQTLVWADGAIFVTIYNLLLPFVLQALEEKKAVIIIIAIDSRGDLDGGYLSMTRKKKLPTDGSEELGESCKLWKFPSLV